MVVMIIVSLFYKHASRTDSSGVRVQTLQLLLADEGESRRSMKAQEEIRGEQKELRDKDCIIQQ